MYRWVVRVVDIDERCGALLECLRYAGLVNLPGSGVVDIKPPPGVTDSKAWADANAARFESFGFNAVAAPEWRKLT